jgi:regulator of replication initiation timing
MIKCKLALNNEVETDCGKDICCFTCDDRKDCVYACDLEDPENNCLDRVVIEEEKTELQVMQEVLPDKLQEVTDLMIQMKKAEAQITKIKEALLKAMEDNGIKKFENEKLTFTYVAPTTRKTFDKKAFEKAHPEIDLDQFDKVSNVKASVRIAVK